MIDFVAQNKLNYSPIPDGEKNQLRDVLAASSNIPLKLFEKESFFKVPFEEVIELVAMRRVFVMAGNAYVPSSELITLITSVFRTRLSQALVVRP